MFIFVALSGITAQSVIGYIRWVKPVGCQSRHWHRFGNGGRLRESIRNMVLVCIAAKGTAHVACVCARACAHACVRAHFCACVRACLRVCVRVYAHLNMCTKFTKHSGQRARIYVQLIACKCTGTKGCGFTLQRMIGYIQQLYPLGITAEHWGPSKRL